MRNPDNNSTQTHRLRTSTNNRGTHMSTHLNGSTQDHNHRTNTSDSRTHSTSINGDNYNKSDEGL